jgi:hypothetical protein|tara:strand:+ start:1674 stop:2780 length:1107 start_codon:yes stop_codon:yes gene_type:complete
MSAKEKFIDRYLNPDKLNLFLGGLKNLDKLSIIGYSEENRPIYGIKIGDGSIKVLIWSQMHGNETTTTKALCRLLELLENPTHRGLISKLTLNIIPQLNPDGAAQYTRLNSNSIDLNRDAVDLSQSESKALSNMFNGFKPDFCFNLHGQRSLYSAGHMGLPATVSLLAPSGGPEGSISSSRSKSMKVIAAVNQALQIDIPGQIGRYDDLFNINCVGDKFSNLGTSTILFEAGHYPNDYNRNITTNYVLKALIDSIKIISSGDYNNYTTDQYFNIPENKNDYCDLLIKGVSIVDQGKEYKNQELVINFKEELESSKINFVPYMIDYADFWTGLSHQSIQIELTEIKNKIVFDKQKPFLQAQSEINKIIK